MYNDPELNPQYIGQITQDFVKLAELLKEACYQVITRGFSKFPIIVMCKTEQAIGSRLLSPGESEDLDIQWHYYLSYIEEFMQRGLLDEEGLERFAATYKNSDEFCTVFVVEKETLNFIHIPYPED